MAERPHQRVVIRKLTLPFILLAGVAACSLQADEASAEQTALASLQQWSKQTIRWDFFRARPSGVPGLPFEGAVQSAANAWDQVSNVDLQRINVSVGSPALADVLVTWVSAPDDPLWGTPPAYAKLMECQDVNTRPCEPPLIVFMAVDGSGGPVKWSLAANTPADAYDVITVAVHEWGHVLGMFGHCPRLSNCDNGSVMGSSFRGEQRRNLTAGDIARIRALFP